MNGVVSASAFDEACERPERVTLLEVLDRVLTKGVVVVGDVTISVADVDLVYLHLRVLLCSVETALKNRMGLRKDTP
jgi:hypothetical protein